MSEQPIIIGNAPNDGTGDTLRAAFGKANSNFSELYALAATDPYPKVENFAALPAATGSGAVYLVRVTTGLIGFRKLAGLWQDNAVGTWDYLGLYGRSANEIANVPGAGSSAITVQAAIDDIGARSTDGWVEGATNLYFTAARVRAVLLTGISFAAATAVLATDTVLVAFGKLQAQITALTTTVSGKEPAIAAGNGTQYWRGDKSFQTLDKTAVGLGSVDNTADANKPISTATATALTGKASTAHTHVSTDITDFTEASQDAIGGMVTAAGGSYNDAAGTVIFPGGVDFVDAGLRPLAHWQAAGASTTITAIGEAALTATGTATASPAIATTNAATATRLLEYLVTVAATTAVAGFRTAANKFFLGNVANRGGFKSVCRFSPSTGVATTTNRCFVGFRPVAAPTDVEPSTLINMFGVGWDAADANIQIMRNDATTTATKIDLGANFPVPTVDRTKVYELRLDADPNSTTINWRFMDMDNPAQAQTGSFNTDIPAVNVMLGFNGHMSVGGTSSVIGIGLATLAIQG